MNANIETVRVIDAAFAERDRLRAINAELLAALVEFVRMDDESGLFLNSQDSHGSTLVVALDQARAAVAKAKQ